MPPRVHACEIHPIDLLGEAARLGGAGLAGSRVQAEEEDKGTLAGRPKHLRGGVEERKRVLFFGACVGVEEETWHVGSTEEAAAMGWDGDGMDGGPCYAGLGPTPP